MEMRLWEEHCQVRMCCVHTWCSCSSLVSSRQSLWVYLLLSRKPDTCHVQLQCDLAKWQIFIRDQEELLIRNDNVQSVIYTQASSDGRIALLNTHLAINSCFHWGQVLLKCHLGEGWVTCWVCVWAKRGIVFVGCIETCSVSAKRCCNGEIDIDHSYSWSVL